MKPVTAVISDVLAPAKLRNRVSGNPKNTVLKKICIANSKKNTVNYAVF